MRAAYSLQNRFRPSFMERLAKQSTRRVVRLRAAFLIALAVCMSACADRPSPNAAGPRPNEVPYPVLMTDNADRREAALTAWTKLTNDQGITNAPAPELQPVTATIRSLPTQTNPPLYLTKVGEAATMSEEETRESLRRFITSASALLGAEPQQLSLVQRTDLADGTKKARYEQRPFRYPLRNDYGVLEITFAPDRRIIQITSTCIPEIEQLQRAGTGIRTRWTSDKVPEQIIGKTFTYTDATGNQQTLTIAQGQEITVRELVIYPRPRVNDPLVLEFHLAWEITIGHESNSPVIYMDAVTDEIISVKQVSR
jgi:hypothetical protein